MAKIAMFGGTFNPVHKGHIRLARALADGVGADRVIWVPAAVPPHKKPADLADGADRLAMCRLACEEDPRFIVSDQELVRPGESYTVYTLRELKESYPADERILFMGSDMFLTVQDWYLAGEIFSLATLAAAARHAGEKECLTAHQKILAALGAKTAVIPAPVYDISSSQVRQMIKCGQDAGEYLPLTVWEYIRQNKLYQEGTSEWI